jgi:hypothetical protein
MTSGTNYLLEVETNSV